MDLSNLDNGVFLLNLLGLVHNPKDGKILIAKRENDPHIPDLSWCFPGGRANYGSPFNINLEHIIDERAGIVTTAGRVIQARSYPENPKIASIYFECKYDLGTIKPGTPFTELKWINPSETRKYFTTSVDAKVQRYLDSLKA